MRAQRKLSSTPTKSSMMVIMYDNNANDVDKAEDSPQHARLGFYLQQLIEVGMKHLQVGSGSDWNGWGSKMQFIAKALDSLDDELIVVVSDSRDVLVNPVAEASEKFVAKFEQMTSQSKDAIVLGAEKHCCVAAMSHAVPGQYFNKDGSRKERACNSGAAECRHLGYALQEPWIDAMRSLAHSRGHTDTEYPIVNVGLMAGRVKDLRALFKLLDLAEGEDDQAVISDAVLTFPERFVLDYDQELFGSNNWAQGVEVGCLFDWNEDHFVHKELPDTIPSFFHFQGKFFECYNHMARHLTSVPERALEFEPLGCNYYNYNYDNYYNYYNYDCNYSA